MIRQCAWLPGIITTVIEDCEALRSLYRRHGEWHRAGSTIVHQADRSAELYVVLDGQVEFWVRSTGGRRVLSTAGPGAVFGEVACFAGGARSASATALTDCAVLRLSRAAALELIERSPGFAMQVVRTLGERLYAATHGEPAAPAPLHSIDDLLAGAFRAA